MNLGGMEAVAKEVAGKAILDHAIETERKLVSAGRLTCAALPGIYLKVPKNSA